MKQLKSVEAFGAGEIQVQMQDQPFAFFSSAGLMVIRNRAHGWEAWLDRVKLGEGHATAQQALNALKRGDASSPVVTAGLAQELPSRIEDWKPVIRIECGSYPRRTPPAGN